MQRFEHDGIEIAFLDEGQGEPIVLVHGFASTAEMNWVHPGWVATLTSAPTVLIMNGVLLSLVAAWFLLKNPGVREL